MISQLFFTKASSRFLYLSQGWENIRLEVAREPSPRGRGALDGHPLQGCLLSKNFRGRVRPEQVKLMSWAMPR